MLLLKSDMIKLTIFYNYLNVYKNLMQTIIKIISMIW